MRVVLFTNEENGLRGGNGYRDQHAKEAANHILAFESDSGVFAPARIVATPDGPRVQTPLGALANATECPLPSAYPNGECDVLLRADDIVHDDTSPWHAAVAKKAFRGADFLYTLTLASGTNVLSLVPSHHDHALGEKIGIRLAIDHVVAFPAEV